MKNRDNAEKQKSGQQFQEALVEKFIELELSGTIKSFQAEQKFAHKGFSYPNQYLANFVIETIDEKFIIVNSSKSFRSDRVKTQFWDVNGIINNSEISDSIVASIILYSDEEKGAKGFENHRRFIENKHSYSPASHIFLVGDFIEFLDNYKTEIESRVSDASFDVKEIRKLPAETRGSEYGKLGIQFEKDLVLSLNDLTNLEKFKKSELEINHPFQLILTAICKKSDLGCGEINSVNATDTVPLLRSGGNPKTDIVVEVVYNRGVIMETISIKNSTQSRVSCHDYKVEDYIRVLDCQGTKLETYLRKFQDNPTYRSFNDAMHGAESSMEFEKLIKPLGIRLTEWALKGAHDEKNLVSPKLQVSNFLYANSKNGVSCYSMDEYIQYIFDNVPLIFEVPLSWTYPSKQKSKRIQLKVPLESFDSKL